MQENKAKLESEDKKFFGFSVYPEPGAFRVEVAKGFGLGLLLSGLFVYILYLGGRVETSYQGTLINLAEGAFFTIGVSQLIVIIPAIVVANRRKARGIKIGLIIAASLIALLNAACFGFIFLVLLSM